MDSLISRKAAIDALDTIESEVADGEGFRYAKWREYFENLPSAQPEPKQNTMPEQLKMNRFGVKMGKTCTDAISRQDAIGAVNTALFPKINTAKDAEKALRNLPSAQPDSFVDADKLKRCRFEYINACKIVARPTPDTSKNDIYDAHAVIKALYPIFGDEEF